MQEDLVQKPRELVAIAAELRILRERAAGVDEGFLAYLLASAIDEAERRGGASDVTTDGGDAW